MRKQFKTGIVFFIFSIMTALIANNVSAAEPSLSIDELLRRIGHDNICPLIKDHKISKLQSSTVWQMQQALQKEIENIETRTQYINNLQQKYQQSQDFAYRLANQGMTEQLKENRDFLKKQENRPLRNFF